MVAEGIGYGIIPGRAVQLSKPTLKKCTSLSSFDDEITLVYRPEFGKIPAEKLLIESLKEIFWTRYSQSGTGFNIEKKYWGACLILQKDEKKSVCH